MNRFPRLSLLVLLLAGQSTFAATTPYLENFDDDPLASSTPSETGPEAGAFNPNTAAQWSVLSGGISGQSYRNSYTTDGTTSTSAVDFSGVLGGAAAGANNFTFSTSMRFNTGTAGTAGATPSTGLGFLGTTNAYASGYFVDLSFVTGGLRIVRNTSVIPGGFSTGTPALGEVYTLTITGTYADTTSDGINDQLRLTATISGGTGPNALFGTITYNDSAPIAGTFFGYRSRTNSSSDLNVDFVDFSLTSIPEPGISALLFAGAVFSLGARRRP